MSNKIILTTGARVSQVELSYNSPQVVFTGTEIALASTYCFLSKVTPWANNEPELPRGDIKYQKQVLKNMFVAKLVTASDISPVIKRIDWTSGVVYEHYSDDVDMVEVDTNGNLLHNFYVKNKYDQVFKCLWNNNNGPSTVQPYFEPGTYNAFKIFTGADGYKWKFMFTIDAGYKVKFMDKVWMPIPLGANTPSPLITTAGAGSIEAINILTGGSGYDDVNYPISVNIIGDGYGAAGTAKVVGGSITDVIITNQGSDYTTANVVITSAVGSNATAFASTSPVGGHGFDPISELGCSHVMFTAEFSGGENGDIPTDITFYQLGLVTNPSSRTSQLYAKSIGLNSTLPTDGLIYRTSTDFIVAPGFGSYTSGDTVFQGPDNNINNATFRATILSFDVATNVLRLINTSGVPLPNGPVRNADRTNRTLLTYTTPDYSIFSGYLSFIENRSGIQRSSDGVEQVRMVIGY
jgi:hypothetical protein